MKYVAYVGHNEVVTETERPITCCLVGQRDETAERPEELMKHWGVIRMGPKPEGYKELTKEEQATLSKFDRDKRGGRFAPKVLAWFESTEEAEADRINWPDRINFKIVPVSASFA